MHIIYVSAAVQIQHVKVFGPILMHHYGKPDYHETKCVTTVTILFIAIVSILGSNIRTKNNTIPY